MVAEHPELIDLNFRLSEVAGRETPWGWTHSNGIDYNPELDQIMLSPRHFSEVWIIDHSTTRAEAAGSSGGNSGQGGDLLYRWGNPRAYRAGTLDDQQLFWPHNPQWIPPGQPGAGNILIFNNGLEFPDFRRDYSSVDEIVPPVDGANYRLNPGVAYAPEEPVWTYTAATPSDFFASALSGAQRLPNGNTLICDGVNGTLFEVTPAGKTVWKYVNPTTSSGPLRQGEPVPTEQLRSGREVPANQVYRAYRYAPDYPGLQGMDLTPGEPIELDSTYSDCFWQRMEPHFDYQSGDVGVIVDGRMVQAFARDCAPDELAVWSWSGLADSDWFWQRMEPHFDYQSGDVGVIVDGRMVQAFVRDRPPVIRSDWDVYLSENTLIYVKEPCAPADVDATFFLHLDPVDMNDLPEHRQQHGFDNLDFNFYALGAILDGKCLAELPLPEYAISEIRTGQYVPVDGGYNHLWEGQIRLNE